MYFFTLARRFTAISSAVALVVVGALSACVGSERATEGGGDWLRVALLTPGPISDKSWNGGAYAGLERIRDSLGARISHIQVKTPADFEENFRQYAASGYTLVIGHGFEFQEAAARVAGDYPKTVFVTTGGETVRQNVAALSFAFDEPSYLAGMAAAFSTKTGTVACVGGTELPPVKSSFAAFTAGARSVRPDVRVIVTYVGNWDDMSAGREQALALVRRGADVIFQNADAAGLGVFQAARDSKGLFVIGSNSNQNAIAPSVTLGSVVIDIPHAFLLVAREIADKSFTARVIRLGTTNDVVRWEPASVLAGQVPATAIARIDSVRSAMRTGAFTMPASP